MKYSRLFSFSVFFSLIFGILCNTEPAFCQETRLSRQVFFAPSTWQSFIQWKERFIHPVFCPVVLCHGSCGAFADACVLYDGPVISRFSTEEGCQGSCH